MVVEMYIVVVRVNEVKNVLVVDILLGIIFGVIVVVFGFNGYVGIVFSFCFCF